MTDATPDQLAADVAAAERDYDRAMRAPRGEGLTEAGQRLHRLYAQQRVQGTVPAETS